MITTCWAVKGGSGTTVVAAGLAVTAAKRKRSALDGDHDGGGKALIIDLKTDVAAVMGLTLSSTALGLSDWMCADESVEPSALLRLVHPTSRDVSVLCFGNVSHPFEAVDGDRLRDGLRVLSEHFAEIVIDVGTETDSMIGRTCIEMADRSLLVVRPCYLSLRLAIESTLPAHACVVVSTDGRTLDRHDVAAVLGIPVAAQLPFDHEIARLVDSGLFGQRVPRSVDRLRRVAV